MRVQTEDGIAIYVLPDCAKCTLSGKHPDNTMKCPQRAFDCFGDVCAPELCEFYVEDWEEDSKGNEAQ